MAQEREETQEELMERIKNMSPEELKEFQKSRCIFCHIIAGKIPAKKVYEDAKCIAILDINAATKGHVLLMPKDHYAIMPQVPEEIIKHLGIVTKKISNVALKSLGAAGTNVLIQNGMAAGQKAQHFMMHVIPRYSKDEVPLVLDKKMISDSDYLTIYTRLKKQVRKNYGLPEENPAPITQAPQFSLPTSTIQKPVQQTIAPTQIDTIAKANDVVHTINEEIENLEKETPIVRSGRKTVQNPQSKEDIDSIKKLLSGDE